MATSTINNPTNRVNAKTLQIKIFRQRDANGDETLQTISTYPTSPGVYRVGAPNNISGLPKDSNGYGCLLIFDCGGYVLHIFVDVSMNLYYTRTTSSYALTTWYKLEGTEVAAR